MKHLSDYISEHIIIAERIKIDNVNSVVDFRDPYFQISGLQKVRIRMPPMEFDDTTDDWYGCVVNWYNDKIGCPAGETLLIWSVSVQEILAFIPRNGQLYRAWIFFCKDKEIPEDPDEARKTFEDEKEFNSYFNGAPELYHQIYFIKHYNCIKFLSPKLQKMVDNFCKSSSN